MGHYILVKRIIRKEKRTVVANMYLNDKQTIERKIFAFVHIEKAAGTTLNHILRKNFFLKYIDVRPLDIKSNRVLRSADLKKYFFINPKLECISGHSITPSCELIRVFPNIKFFTVLRNPIQRYISQFRYLVKINRIKDDFEKFLSDTKYDNFQTKKIAGEENLEKAKDILKNNMMEVGVVEEFDFFLLRLRKNIYPAKFDPTYKKKNITGKDSRSNELLSLYENEIEMKNNLDIQLYDCVVNQIIFKKKSQYGEESLQSDLKRMKKLNQNSKPDLRNYLDYIFRKIYYEPLTGYIRKKSGLRAKGSY